MENILTVLCLLGHFSLQKLIIQLHSFLLEGVSVYSIVTCLLTSHQSLVIVHILSLLS